MKKDFILMMLIMITTLFCLSVLFVDAMNKEHSRILELRQTLQPVASEIALYRLDDTPREIASVQ
jgi:hypothetical protein